MSSKLAGLPKVDVKVEVPITWWKRFLAHESQYYDLSREIAVAIGATMRTLGVPGTPEVSLSAVRDDTLLPNRLIRVFVNGRWCPFPADVWSFAWSYAAGSPHASIELYDIFEHLGLATASTSVNPHALLVLACTAAIYAQPSTLFGDESFACYLWRLNSLPTKSPEHTLDLPHNILQVALNKALDLKISIANIEKVHHLLLRSKLQRPDKLSELLITALCPRRIDIHIRKDTLHLLTTLAYDTNTAGHFVFLRRRLFRRTGLNFPAFRFMVNDLLKKHSIAVQINHLTSLPRILFGFPNNAWSDVLTIVEDTLCMNAAHFIDAQSVEELLSAVQGQYPLLVNTVEAQYSAEQVADIFRHLVNEGLPIRPIRVLLEGILDPRVLVANSSSVTSDEVVVVTREQTGIHMSNHDRLVASLRVKMRRHITAQYARPDNVIRPLYPNAFSGDYILRNIKNQDPDVTCALDWVAWQEVLDSIHGAVRHLDGRTPLCVICEAHLRQRLRELIHFEFPHLPVLTNQELGPNVSIKI